MISQGSQPVQGGGSFPLPALQGLCSLCEPSAAMPAGQPLQAECQLATRASPGHKTGGRVTVQAPFIWGT